MFHAGEKKASLDPGTSTASKPPEQQTTAQDIPNATSPDSPTPFNPFDELDLEKVTADNSKNTTHGLNSSTNSLNNG